MIFGYFIATFFGNYSKIFEPLGTIFIRLLKMIIVPLVSTSIILGVSSIGNTKTFTRIGIKTLFYYLSTSLIAIIIGLTLTNIIQPGNGVTLTNVDPYNIDIEKPSSLFEIIIRMIPINPIKAAAQGDMLGIIFFSILLGIGITNLSNNKKNVLLPIIESLFTLITNITMSIIKLAPIGVLGLIITTINKTQSSMLFESVGLYMITIFLGLIIHLFLILP